MALKIPADDSGWVFAQRERRLHKDELDVLFSGFPLVRLNIESEAVAAQNTMAGCTIVLCVVVFSKGVY